MAAKEGKMDIDKRRNPRANIGITLFHDGGFSRTKDISIDGTFIKSSKQSQLQPIGSYISLSFDFPSKTRLIKVKGVVVHHGNNDGLGIYFEEISKRSKRFIKQFLSNYL